MNIEQRTPVPALGDGWFLLRDDEVLRHDDKVTVYEDMSRGWVDAEELEGRDVAYWRGRTPGNRAARYFGPAKEPEPVEDTEQPKPIDWTKPVRTKLTKWPVTLVTVKGRGEYPVIGYVGDNTDLTQWDLRGSKPGRGEDYNGLENAPQRIQREYWVNVYPGNIGEPCMTKEAANSLAKYPRLACVKITIDCEEGEGL